LSTNAPDKGDVWPEVLEWLRVAASDQRVAGLCLAANPPQCDVAAFLCQQAAEKLLKGFLVSAGDDFRKTHDLEKLGQSVLMHYPSLEAIVVAAGDWTAWNVAYRYPGEAGPEPEPTAMELAAVLDLIARLSDMLRSLGPPSERDDTTQGA
jgi:HEPN domain-containing protein